MARFRLFAVLVIALSAGVALAYGTYSYMQNIPVKTVSLPTQPVVVAATDLELGSELRAEDLRIVQWPTSSLPQGVFSNPSELVGRGVIMPLIENELILPMKLASKEAGAGLPPVIPPGMRAVSVRVNEVIGVAGYVLPGTHVDVVATANPTNQQEMVTSKVVLTNVPVLAAGTKIAKDAQNNQAMAVSVVTLLVTPEESERLTLASTEGKIQLALRNPLDTGTPVTPGVRPAVLMGAPPPPRPAVRRSGVSARPAPPPVVAVVATPPPPTVEIIRGDKRAHEVVK